MRMMSPSIFISCTSVTPATGDAAPPAWHRPRVSVMKAPVALWPGTLAHPRVFDVNFLGQGRGHQTGRERRADANVLEFILFPEKCCSQRDASEE